MHKNWFMERFVFFLLPDAIIITVYDRYWGSGHVVPADLIYSYQSGVLLASMKIDKILWLSPSDHKAF